MANRYKVTLTRTECRQLTELTRSGKSTAAKFVHARALLLCDAGKGGDPWKVADVAAALGVTSRTIEHLKQRFVEDSQRRPVAEQVSSGLAEAGHMGSTRACNATATRAGATAPTAG